MKNISLVQLVSRVLHSSHDARLQSHLRFWADSEHPISQLWSATKNISGRCSQRTMREDTLKNTPLLTNSFSAEQGGVRVFGNLTSAVSCPGLRTEGICTVCAQVGWLLSI